MGYTLEHIAHFKTISEFMEALNQPSKGTDTDFHITKFSEFSMDVPMEMPPYRKDFYQVNYITEAYTSNIRLNTRTSDIINNTIYFVSPEHIYSWKRAERIEGYLLYFSKEFFNLFQLDIEEEFDSLFDLKRENTLALSAEQSESIIEGLRKLHRDYQEETAFKTEILKSFLLTLLYRLKAIRETRSETGRSSLKTSEKFIQFRNLVKNKFIAEKSVRYYASQLNVTPNYLNELSKKEKQKSAKQFIHDVVINEAKKLLVFTQKDVAEIAFSLGYDEPTHFSRFFKSRTTQTPLAFRRLHH